MAAAPHGQLVARRGRREMRKDIYWVCSFSIEPERFAEFREVVEPLVAATRQEPGSLANEYSVSEDHRTIHIIERYRDSDAVISHVQQTFARFAERFSALATLTSFVLYGAPSPEAREIIDGFGATYMIPFEGFTR
jgi:quinol monooxygenase YgiN